ncbi:L,D-transpeptidase [Cellulomonas bogoriensis]|uniref:L,D-TPase catalytic domain-containing protein n=1 Tax=Cellulomonas bogoriensis 69B4 = DSM 16987 TaxID=1386082 RepID=A0A0A0BNG5_9CELL|nr:L,D-transpeptidase [Cellulomonas bogoriensis]KGM08609.1 hypothetical protein N869_07595 [Cellulomonas bogoriensis 69B4 = DSM 16987]
MHATRHAKGTVRAAAVLSGTALVTVACTVVGPVVETSPGPARATATQPQPPVARTAPPVPVVPPMPEVDREGLPPADPWAVLPQAPADPDPTTMPDGTLATPLSDAGAVLHDAPGGQPFAVLPQVQYLGQTSYPVIDTHGPWHQVLLTVRRGLPSEVGPGGVNEATGWVHLDEVELHTTDHRIVIDLGEGTVTLSQGTRVLARTEAGYGAPGTPTPETRTFVMSIHPDPAATYSPLFVMFGASSPTLDQFLGGPAPIAIHTFATHRGPISNGCLRVPADALDPFTEVPLGTPVLITS